MKNTSDQGLKYWPKHMCQNALPLVGHVDASFGSKATTYKSTFGYCFHMFGGLIMCKSKKVTIQAISVNEAEYFAANEATRDAIHLRRLVEALGYTWDGPVLIGEDNRQVILDAIKAIQGLEGNVTTNARGAQVYTKPTLALVAEKPGTAEYIMSDRNLARLAETIATQKENQTMSSMIPIMMNQGGGGTSMPVINNSYSYQNTENTVREMPTTSSLNMMTALA